MTSIFSQDKRNFIHKQLDEVIFLWARGTGQGTFVFTINDGIPELQLGIQLGLEDAPGHHQQQLPCQHQHHLTPRRQRGPARRQRDRQRAARHQAAKKASSAAHHAHGDLAAATAVILPFTGNLLPVNGRKTPSGPSPIIPRDAPHSKAAASAVLPSRTVVSVVSPGSPRTAVTVAPPAATAVSPASPSSGPPTVARPMKASQISQADLNVEFVKKKLFQAPLQQQASIPASGRKKTYQMKEDDLWTKLFSK